MPDAILYRNWGTHGDTYKTKCTEQRITMFPGVEPLEAPVEDIQLRDGNIGPFMQVPSQAKPVKWTKEGLLEHIVELVVVEDKV
jgi:hypothetical protein